VVPARSAGRRVREEFDVGETTTEAAVPLDFAAAKLLGKIGGLVDAATAVVRAELEDTPGGMVEGFRRELEERRACLVGALDDLSMVRDTLLNAESLELARTSLVGPVEERIRLVSQAIGQTDEALSR
jgi:hypothetical protein